MQLGFQRRVPLSSMVSERHWTTLAHAKRWTQAVSSLVDPLCVLRYAITFWFSQHAKVMNPRKPMLDWLVLRADCHPCLEPILCMDSPTDQLTHKSSILTAWVTCPAHSPMHTGAVPGLRAILYLVHGAESFAYIVRAMT